MTTPSQPRVNTFNELYYLATSLFPDAEVGEDNDGQIIIYTNLTIDPTSSCEALKKFEED